MLRWHRDGRERAIVCITRTFGVHKCDDKTRHDVMWCDGLRCDAISHERPTGPRRATRVPLSGPAMAFTALGFVVGRRRGRSVEREGEAGGRTGTGTGTGTAKTTIKRPRMLALAAVRERERQMDKEREKGIYSRLLCSV